MAADAGASDRAGALIAAPPANLSRGVASWPCLDGLRAIAVLAVIFYHLGVLRGGYLGVDVFFVLSGFLITSLLITEWDSHGGRIAFRNFYVRRALRLLPALGCVLIASIAVAALLYVVGTPAAYSYARATVGAVPWVLGFAGDWARAAGASNSLGALGHTWSLAVEEQFYLLWPALFVLLMRRRLSRRTLAGIIAGLAAADVCYREYLAHVGVNYDRIFYGPDTHCDGLLIGCSLALWLASRPSRQLTRARERAIQGAAWLGTGGLAILFLTGTWSGLILEESAAAVWTGVVVLAAVLGVAPGPLQRLLSSRLARSIGRRSYGLYLWHYVMFSVPEMLDPAYLHSGGIGHRALDAMALTAALGAAFAGAWLSYRYVELPALRLKRRFSPDEAQVGAAPVSEDGSTSRPPSVGVATDSIAAAPPG